MRAGMLSGWVVAAASLSALGGMSIAGYGAFGSAATSQSAAAPPATCVNGAGDLGDTYYPGIGNGGYDVSHYDLNLKYDPDDADPRREGDDHRRRDPEPVPVQPRPARAHGVTR